MIYKVLFLDILFSDYDFKSLQDTRESHMIMMIMVMMINSFYVMVDRQDALSLISSWDHCQRFLPSQISDTPRTGFEPAQSLCPGFVEGNCAVKITTTRRCSIKFLET